MRLRIVTLLLVLAGCHQTRIVNPSAGGERLSSYDGKWNHNFIMVLNGTGRIHIDKIRPGGRWSEVEIHTGLLQVPIWVLTVGIWTPQTITIYCGERGVAWRGTLEDGSIRDLRRANPRAVPN